MIKKLLPAALLALAVSTAVADAQRYQSPPPDLWCRDEQYAWSIVPICAAYTFEQCLASRSNHTERCYINPRYARDFNR
ncbi:MAG: hypothetical protein KF794_10810 [Xanthobacteraceae bacterium]|nr:hypothetical protein [Xanthobacteraceae bacterium]QYK44273.1 MAG: hypothetical protein KF794_10810 [Xanthobacteraceae bacterium]HMN51977.1 hypothetical protein [Xanthobacteraceae bacterium]